MMMFQDCFCDGDEDNKFGRARFPGRPAKLDVKTLVSKLHEESAFRQVPAHKDIALGRLLKNPPRQSGRLNMLERR